MVKLKWLQKGWVFVCLFVCLFVCFFFGGGDVEFGNLVEDVDGIFGGVSMCAL